MITTDKSSAPGQPLASLLHELGRAATAAPGAPAFYLDEGDAGLEAPARQLDPTRDRGRGVGLRPALEHDAVDYATRHGVVVVAAGGNCVALHCPERYASWPAALPHVIGVGALTPSLTTPAFSNRDRRHIDLAAPDIYMPESNKVTAVLKSYQRPDNALMVPEMGNAAGYARYVYQIVGMGALGVAPFGLDYFDYSNYPLGSKFTDRRMVEPFATVYGVFAPMQRQWARWAFEGRTHGVAEGDVDVAWVPGAFEIPFVAQKMAASGRYDAVVALGVVIRGGTPHFEYVASEVSKGVAKAALDSGVPVMFGVITADTIDQAVERAGTKVGNKGWDAANAAIEMANLMKSMA